jgi:hypothetical protein
MKCLKDKNYEELMLSDYDRLKNPE